MTDYRKKLLELAETDIIVRSAYEYYRRGEISYVEMLEEIVCIQTEIKDKYLEAHLKTLSISTRSTEVKVLHPNDLGMLYAQGLARSIDQEIMSDLDETKTGCILQVH